MNFATVTVEHSGDGAHARRKALFKGMGKRGDAMLWIGPNQDDIRGFENVCFLPIHSPVYFSNIPFVGTLIALIVGIRNNRNNLTETSCFLAFGELEILAARLFLHNIPIVFIQRNDIVEKSRVVSRNAASVTRKARLLLRSRMIHMLQKLVLPSLAHIIVQTPHHKRRLTARFEILPPISVVPNDVPDDREDATIGKKKSTKDVPIVGFLGRVEWEVKGIALLLEVFLKIRERLDARLEIAGNGRDLELLRSKVKVMELESDVLLKGKIADTRHFLSNIDVLLLTSPYDDCPNVLLEALQANVPIIATRIDAHEFLLAESPGLCEQADANQFAETAIRSFTDNEFRQRLLTIQQQRAKKFTFDWTYAMSEALHSA